MLRFQDFVPEQIHRPGVFSQGEYESFQEILDRANKWIDENTVRIMNVETVVLPNIWSHWEDGSEDTSLGIGGGAGSRWYQFIRVWYQE